MPVPASYEDLVNGFDGIESEGDTIRVSNHRASQLLFERLREAGYELKTQVHADLKPGEPNYSWLAVLDESFYVICNFCEGYIYRESTNLHKHPCDLCGVYTDIRLQPNRNILFHFSGDLVYGNAIYATVAQWEEASGELTLLLNERTDGGDVQDVLRLNQGKWQSRDVHQRVITVQYKQEPNATWPDPDNAIKIAAEYRPQGVTRVSSPRDWRSRMGRRHRGTLNLPDELHIIRTYTTRLDHKRKPRGS